LFLRFGNMFLEPVWNKDYIHSVRISLKEDFGTEGRGGYFTAYGIIRDVIQNHLLQMLCLCAIDKPSNIGGDIRDAKVALLKCMLPMDPDEVVLGQYTGANGLPGFLEDDSIKPADAEMAKYCSTYCQLVIRIDNDRWRGVPFIIRAGKGIDESKCEIRVQFKTPHYEKVVLGDDGVCPRNELVMRVHPDEAIYLKTNVKTPGLWNALTTSELDLSYRERYAGEYFPDAYSRLILAGIRGQKDSFVRTDELSESWKRFTPLLEAIEGGKKEVIKYPRGTRGPKEAEDQLEKLGVLRDTHYKWAGKK